MLHLPDSVESVVASLHPAFAMRGMPQFRDEIRRAIRRAANWSRGEGKFRRPRVRFPASDDFADAIRGSGPLAIDVETDGLSDRITICGVAPLHTDMAYVVPWEADYISIMKEVLESKRVKIGHNFSFDMKAFRAYGIEPQWPVVDTIQAASLVWPPQSRSRQGDGGGDVRWLGLAQCVLRVVDGVPFWKQPGTDAAKAIYRASWPEVPDWQHGWLYCGLDAFYDGLLWLAEQQLLKEMGLWDLFTRIVAPAGLVASRMECRGLLVDPDRRQRMIDETRQFIAERSAAVAAFTAEVHEKRLANIQAAIDGLQATLAACPEHPDYFGKTKRLKSPCCKQVWEANRSTYERIRAGRAKLKSIGPEFKVGSDAHWRWLLFTHLKLKPVSVTKIKKEPQVDDDSIEKLARRNPDLPVLKHRVELQHARHRLSGPLSMEVSADNRVYVGLSLHRSALGRLSSGADMEEEDKPRRSAGGAQGQNLNDKDRRMFVAPPGHSLIQADWSQAEMRVEAWLAREIKMLQAWKDGADIHSFNALDIAKALNRTDVTIDNVRTATFSFMGGQKPFRDAGKRLGLGLIYGMQAFKMSKLYGIPVEACERYLINFFKRWPMIYKFQEDLIRTAEEDRVIINPFGRRLPVYVEWDEKEGKWAADREQVLAYPGQSTVADMIKSVLPAADGIPHAVLDTTTHDSLRFTVPDGCIADVVPHIRTIMEREFPELGEIEGFGLFHCPVDIAIGRNWGKYHATENPDGLREVA
jgi:DNA polymerase I-like protein with 3'-5' exonuclease and polymerase domains